MEYHLSLVRDLKLIKGNEELVQRTTEVKLLTALMQKLSADR